MSIEKRVHGGKRRFRESNYVARGDIGVERMVRIGGVGSSSWRY